MEIKPSYYSILPAIIRYDNELCPNAKLLYSEITSLCNKNGYCFANNSYFAELYQVDKSTISRWISQLENKTYISTKVTYKNNTKSIDKRIIILGNVPIDEIINTYTQNNQYPIDEIVKDNNTSINSNNNIYEIIEKEFGRLLSPLEIETIKTWDYSIEILTLAVKEASTSGNYAIKYIDRIIFNWKKANVKSVADVKKYIADFKERKNNKPRTQAETIGASCYEEF